jgi:hypothetical protein
VWWGPEELRSRLAEVEDAKTLIGLLLYLDAAQPLSEGR